MAESLNIKVVYYSDMFRFVIMGLEKSFQFILIFLFVCYIVFYSSNMENELSFDKLPPLLISQNLEISSRVWTYLQNKNKIFFYIFQQEKFASLMKKRLAHKENICYKLQEENTRDNRETAVNNLADRVYVMQVCYNFYIF